MAQPLALLFADFSTFADLNGVPLVAGTLNFFIAGTTTAQVVYADPNQVTSLGAVVTLNASGQPSNGSSPTGIYILPTGYKLVIQNSNAQIIYTQDNIEAVGETILANFATTYSAGQKSATGGYTVKATDYLVTANGTPINLPAATARTQQLVIKNVSASTVAVTPNGTDTIDTVSGAYTLGAAASPAFPSLLLYSDGISNWWIIASH